MILAVVLLAIFHCQFLTHKKNFAETSTLMSYNYIVMNIDIQMNDTTKHCSMAQSFNFTSNQKWDQVYFDNDNHHLENRRLVTLKDQNKIYLLKQNNYSSYILFDEFLIAVIFLIFYNVILIN